MEILNATEAYFGVDDDLLDFALDVEAEPENIYKGASASSSSSLTAAEAAAFGRGTHSGSFPEFVEEELEWLSNKDAFPSVETCFGILSDNPGLILNHQSPVSVLENSSTIASCCGSLKIPANFPVRPRSKGCRRKRKAGFGELPDQQLWSNLVDVRIKQESSVLSVPMLSPRTGSSSRMGRRCLHCQTDKTPQWRAGPMGPKTLCNACGVRYKSGRLLPEYRPANSPTFSTALHSNSHRKVVEMRRHKYIARAMGGGVMVDEACGYRVG